MYRFFCRTAAVLASACLFLRLFTERTAAGFRTGGIGREQESLGKSRNNSLRGISGACDLYFGTNERSK